MTPTGGAGTHGALASGCVVALSSALLTCLLLFINGSLVWALLSALAKSGPSWLARPESSQFLLFLVPVLLVVAEWMMIDYVRTRFSRRVDTDETSSAPRSKL